MADEIIIQIDLEQGDIDKPLKSIETKIERSGKRAGSSFGKAFNTDISGALTGFTKQIALAGAAIGGIAAGFVAFKAIDAAKVQEDAVNNLNNALKTSGDFTQEASQSLQNYASDLQKVTRFGDEVILNQLALAKSFGASNDQAKQIVTAAADLSAALGIDLQSATRNVAKTLGGYAGELGETIPALKNLTQEQLRAGEGVKLLGERFRGAAGRDVQTFQGALDQLSNTFGDVLEEIGNLVVKNPAAVKAINALNKIFLQAGNRVKDFVTNFNVITDALIPLSNFADGVIQFVVAPLELVGNVFKVAQSSLNVFVSSFIQAFGELAGGAGQVIALFNPESETAMALQNFAEATNETFQENLGQAKDSLTGILDFPLAEQFATKNEEFRLGLQQLNETIIEESAIAQQTLNEGLTTQNDQLNEKIIESTDKLKVGLQKVNADVSSIIKGGIVRGISGGIQNIVKALAGGQNAFANFGKFLLSTFGDLAIQLGQFFIAQGIAVEALKSISGTGAIAAGAGLIALGTLLKSFADSGGGASAGASGGGSAGVAGFGTQAGAGELSSELADPSARERAEPQTSVAVNVQGSLVQQEELGKFIADTLSESNAKNNLVISDLRTA